MLLGFYPTCRGAAGPHAGQRQPEHLPVARSDTLILFSRVLVSVLPGRLCCLPGFVWLGKNSRLKNSPFIKKNRGSHKCNPQFFQLIQPAKLNNITRRTERCFPYKARYSPKGVPKNRASLRTLPHSSRNLPLSTDCCISL